MNVSVAIASHRSIEDLRELVASLEWAIETFDKPVDVFVARKRADDGVGTVAEEFPWITLIEVDGRPSVPELRGAAILASKLGQHIAVTEDLFAVAPDWLVALETALGSERQVIGGTIENRSPGSVNLAGFLTDYAAFSALRGDVENPDAICGSNVMYHADVARKVGNWASQGLWEPAIHDRLRDMGHSMVLTERARIAHTGNYRFSELVSERFRLGWDYASEAFGEGQRLVFVRALLAPVVPFLQALRLFRTIERAQLAATLRALPAIFLVSAAWSLGEAVGYLFPSREHRMRRRARRAG